MVAIIDYANTKLEVAKFLEDLWPYELALKNWPTFCGAGEGFGDRIVPDHICGVLVSCVCFGHDVGWIVCGNSYSCFSRENWQFYQNLRKLVLANADREKYSKFTIERRCLYYYLAVQTVGWKCFKSSAEDRIEVVDPYTHPGVKAKLYRLAMATWDISIND